MTASDTSGFCRQCDRPVISVRNGFCAACLAATAFCAEDETDEEDPGGPGSGGPLRLGEYDLLDRLGRGGMGVVYRARQAGLDREVALKAIPAGPLADPAAVKRFRAEARAAARLHHPHIVTVYDVGEADGYVFFSMELIAGPTLSGRVRSGGPLAAREAAACLTRVSAGVQHAHDSGLLHRDLKPSNILLGPDDEPKVADFGLARSLTGRGDPELTLTGQTVGTPAYFAPEQAAGGDNLTVRTDVYGLGAVLYFVLTGRTPFPGKEIEQLLRQVREDEPAAPRLFDPSIPRDLETICLKAMEKNPARRYASAALLGADLQSFLAGDPIQARPLGRPARARRWVLRHRALSAALAALFLVCAAGAAGMSVLWLRAAGAAESESAERQRAEHELWNSLVITARKERSDGLAGGAHRALATVRRAAAIHPGPELRDEAIAALAMPDVTPEQRHTWTETAVAPSHSPVFHPRLECVCFAAVDGSFVLADPESGSIRRKLEGLPQQGTFEDPVFSSTGKMVAVTGTGEQPSSACNLRVWTVADGREITLSAPPGVISHLWSGDDRTLVLLRGGSADFFAMPEARFLRTCPVPGGWRGPALSRDGSRLALGYGANVEIRETGNGGLLHALRHTHPVEHSAWNESGDLLAVGSRDCRVHVWDTGTGLKWSECNGHDSLPAQQEFLRHSDLLISAGWDDTIRLWEPRSGRPLLVLTSSAASLLPNSQGKIISLKDWPVVTMRQLHIPAVPQTAREPSAPDQEFSGVMSMAFSGDGSLFFTAGEYGLNAWDSTSLKHLGRVPGRIVSVLASPGNAVAVTGEEGLKRIAWERRRNGVPDFAEPVPLGPSSRCNYAATDASGQLFAVSSVSTESPVGEQISLWKNGSLIRKWKLTAAWPTLAVSPDGNWLATGGKGFCYLGLFNTATGGFQRLGESDPAPVEQDSADCVFSPDGRLLVTQGADDISIWNPVSGARIHRIARPADSLDRIVTFSADSRLLAAAGPHRDVWLIDPASGVKLATLTPSIRAMLSDIAFSPDGRLLVAALANRTLQVWDLKELRRLLAAEGLDWQ